MLTGTIALNDTTLAEYSAENVYVDEDGLTVYDVNLRVRLTSGYEEQASWFMTAVRPGAIFVVAQLLEECTPHLNILPIKE